VSYDFIFIAAAMKTERERGVGEGGLDERELYIEGKLS
jgi:hypothetical protein